MRGEGEEEEKKISARVFTEALSMVKSAAFEKHSMTAPIADLMRYKKDMEAIGRLKIEDPE